jgi:glycosyltransferase involved in cell wall biosynthesis
MVHSEDTWRGGENQLALLMRGLGEAGVQLALAAPPESPIARRAASVGVPCVPLRIRSGLDLIAARRLARHLRQERYDIVHCHSSHAHSVAFLATWRGWNGSRYAASEARDESAGSQVGEEPRRPALVVSRRVDFDVPRRGPGAVKYRHVDLYLAISNGVRDVLQRGGVDPARIAVVPSGIDLARHRALGDTAALRQELGLTAGTSVIGNVAALAPHKAQADFIHAAKIVAAELQPVRFFIVGEGELRRELESLVRRLGMQDTILLTGFREDALELLSLFDCFVLSSRLEGLGTSIMDAQVLGVPVVATRTGGVPELIEDGETGLLAPPGDPEQLAATILRLLRDTELRRRCVRNAGETSARYDYRHMVRGTLEAYRGLLGRADSAPTAHVPGAHPTASARGERCP